MSRFDYLKAARRTVMGMAAAGALVAGGAAHAAIVDIVLDNSGDPNPTFATLGSAGASTEDAMMGALNPTNLLLMEDPVPVGPMGLDTFAGNDPSLDPVIITSADGRTLEFDFEFFTSPIVGATGDMLESYQLLFSVFDVSSGPGSGPGGVLSSSDGAGSVVIDLSSGDVEIDLGGGSVVSTSGPMSYSPSPMTAIGLEFTLTAIEDEETGDALKTSVRVSNLVTVDSVTLPEPGAVMLVLAGLIPMVAVRRGRKAST